MLECCKWLPGCCDAVARAHLSLNDIFISRYDQGPSFNASLIIPYKTYATFEGTFASFFIPGH